MVDLQGERIINLGTGIGKDYIMSGWVDLQGEGIINLGTGIGKDYIMSTVLLKILSFFRKITMIFKKTSLAE